jgi:LuxR family maltose regulon positive regulatory protein
VPAGTIERRRLLALLDGTVSERLTIVVAPPGYGKTVLLSQWAASQGERVRWLTMTPEHNDPERFLRDLRAVLAHPTSGRGRVARADAHRPAPLAPLAPLASILQEMEGTPPTTIVLDDCHLLTHPGLLVDCASLVERAPRSLRWILATRTDPPLHYYRFRLADTLVEIRQNDLAFTRDEAARLLDRLADRQLPDACVDALLARTEGWAAGLHLAALAIRKSDNVAQFVETFAGDDRYVADYLAEKVLGHQPDPVRRFLLATSALGRMNGALCDVVTGQARSQATLEELERTSMFITALDPRREWFRYHPLFRTLLRQHLRDEDPELEIAVLHRAARWHLGRGETQAGIGYLVEAGAWQEALDAALEHASTTETVAGATELARWIDRVPRQARDGRPEAALVHAAALVSSGELDRSAEVLDELDRLDTTEAVRMQSAVLRALHAVAADQPAAAVAAADRVLAAEQGVDETEILDLLGTLRGRADLVGAALVARGLALFAQGRLAEAEVGLRCIPADAHAMWQAQALGAGALLDAVRGRLTDAEQRAQRARVVVERSGLDQSSLAGAFLAESLVAKERGDVPGAAVLIEAAVRAMDGRPQPPLAAWISVEQAHLALLEREPSAGLAALAVQRTGDHAPASWWARTRRAAVEAELLLLLGDSGGAAEALDRAPDQTSTDVLAARMRLAMELDDLAGAGRLLERWNVEDGDVRGRLVRELWAATLDHLEGRLGSALTRMEAVVDEAEAEGDVGLFDAAGHYALGPARAVYRVRPTPFLGAVVERPFATPRTKPVKELVEQLTRSEYQVLALLPSRLSNAEIAARLGVSLNTIKTHLKHIYRKLDVVGRSDAVAAAERMHLL